MEENNLVWLPHLSKEVVEDARGHALDAYVIALEGWRRGLTLRWHTKDSEKFPSMKTWFVDKPGKLFSLSSEDRTHYFFRTRGDKVTNEAVEIGMDKERTKQYLSKAGVPVPNGKRFSQDEHDDEIINYASKTLGFPVVLKPTDGSFGRGVVTNIQDINALKRALDYARRNHGESDWIIEKYIPGDEYRLYVVDDEVVGAIRRVPANVVGDGVNTIRTLIEKKNSERKKNPRLESCLIKIDQEVLNFLESNNYNLESIPEQGTQVFLTNKGNISLGGDPVDCLDDLSDDVKTTAIQTLRSIPGLPHGAVDLIVTNNCVEESGVLVLEVNPTAQIGSILFPLKGKARNVPKAIIDYYFPETIIKGEKQSSSNMYFDFQKVISPLFNKMARNVTVSPHPTGNVVAKRYIVSGSFQGFGYLRWIQKQAFLQRLSGQATIMDDGNIEIIVASDEKSTVENFKHICEEGNDKSRVDRVYVEPWDQPVKVGFEISKRSKKHMKKSQVELKKELNEINKITKELRRTQRMYENISRHIVWRYTSPIRRLIDRFKGKGRGLS